MKEIQEFCNPVVPGFAPDPSVIRVEDTFFLVNSSFQFFPALPIYASRNLQDWTCIGHGINRPSQLDLFHATSTKHQIDRGDSIVITGGLFAPTIRYHKGRFYIICTNTRLAEKDVKFQNFYIYAEDIYSNNWSDPINFDFHGIDPSLFFDDDGRVYVQGAWSLRWGSQPTTTIKQVEIDIETGLQLSDIKDIWGGHVQYDTEGPHIYKRDGYYYLLVAEGGTFEHHLLSVARSRNIWGPYESFENNPILTADGKAELIQNTGHGDLVQDQDGNWWGLVLGVRNDKDRYPLGRETFLAPVAWPKGGWPKFEQPKMSFTRSVPSAFARRQLDPAHKVASENVYIRGFKPELYQLGTEDRTMTLYPTPENLSSAVGTMAFVGHRQRGLYSIATVELSLLGEGPTSPCAAGLTIYKDNLRHAEIYYNFATLQVNYTSTDKHDADIPLSERISALPSPKESSVFFKIESTVDAYSFHWRTNKETPWVSIGQMSTSYITCRDMTGPVFGVFATMQDGHESSPVQFKDFTVTQQS